MRTAVCLAMAMVLATGCRVMDSAYEGTVGMVNPDATRLEAKVQWLSPQPRVRPVSADEMVVFCRVKNSAGANVELDYAVRDQLQRAGYRLTSNMDEARFVLLADTRYFGEKRTASTNPTATGAVIGGATGAVLGNNMGEFDKGTGAVVGAVVGGAMGHVLSNRNKMVELELVVDITLGERIRGGVQTNRKTQSKMDVYSDASVSVGGQQSGRAHGGSEETQTVQLSENFLWHENKVVASARKLKLTLPEAEPILVAKLSRSVAESLP